MFVATIITPAFDLLKVSGFVTFLTVLAEDDLAVRFCQAIEI